MSLLIKTNETTAGFNLTHRSLNTQVFCDSGFSNVLNQNYQY